MKGIEFNSMAEAMIHTKYAGSSASSLPISCSRMSAVDQDRDERQDKSRSTSTKVVDFDLPAKRIRPSASITAQNTIKAIQDALTKKQRVDSIYMACATFDHGIQDVHDEEISAGADIALCKHLAFLLLKRQNAAIVNDHVPRNAVLEDSLLSPFSTDADECDIAKEIGDTTTAIEMVHRCSAEKISIAFNRTGLELLPLLINEIQLQLGLRGNYLLHRPRNESIDASDSEKGLSSIATDDSEDCSTESINNQIAGYPSGIVSHRHRSGSHHLKSCTKIIAHFARVGSLTEILAASKGLLSTLQHVISSPEDTGTVTVEARLNCLWILANLACSAENMITMARNPGLLRTLIEVVSHPSKEDEEKADSVMQYMELLRCRSIGLRAILNLSWAHENKTLFSEDVRLVEVLLSTANHLSSSWGGNGKGVSGVLLQSRRHAAGALRNLAAAPRRTKRHLCRLRYGQFLDEIANIARDPDSDVRDKVHATLWNLVSADTAKLYTEKKHVLDIIAREAMTTGSVRERNDSASTMAARTLRSLEKTIPEDEEGYNILRPIICMYESSLDCDITSVSEVSSMRVEAI